MHRVTINVPENLYLQLRARAKQNDHSLQEELLLLMRMAYAQGGQVVQASPREPTQKSSRQSASAQQGSNQSGTKRMRPLETLRKRWGAGAKKKKAKAAKTTMLGDLVRTIGRERKTGMKKLLKKIRRRG